MKAHLVSRDAQSAGHLPVATGSMPEALRPTPHDHLGKS